MAKVFTACIITIIDWWCKVKVKMKKAATLKVAAWGKGFMGVCYRLQA